MKLEYIKANGMYYIPQEAGVKNPNTWDSNYPVCIIKKLWFGRWQIDYYDFLNTPAFVSDRDENKPNTRIVLYPNGIEEIKWLL